MNASSYSNTSSCSVGIFVLQALIIIIGWGIVHLLSTRRDIVKSRKELIVSTIDELIASVSRTLLEANKYHSTIRDISLENKLKMDVQDLIMQFGKIERIAGVSESLRCLLPLKNYRQAVTGQHFADEHTGPCDPNSTIFQEIAKSALELKRHLLDLKFAQFL